jgi:uncharacterized surface protein with fasciclin (FAS1) repeats
VKFKFAAIATVSVGIALGGAACGSSGASNSASGSSASPSSSSSMAASATPSTSTVAAPFGSACSSVPSSGAGSFQGMATAPVATAASNNPVLSTLVTAVKKAGLVDTLNGASNITVFAPDNAAFAKIPSATLNTVLGNKAELTKILTYHVVSGTVTPAQLASGTALKTLEGTTVAPSKMGSTYEVNGASVVCGDVRTANATVYIIDSVLMPKS